MQWWGEDEIGGRQSIQGAVPGIEVREDGGLDSSRGMKEYGLMWEILGRAPLSFPAIPKISGTQGTLHVGLH